MIGRIFKISRFAINDGEGIRTTIFLCGCKLRCKWCHNPEGLDRNGGYECDSSEIISVALKDKSFYDTTNGGITLSGGEPLVQEAFCVDILKKAKEHGLNTAIETSGCVPPKTILNVCKYTDAFLFDFKHYNGIELKNLTKANYKTIENNLILLNSVNANVILRCPIIPTVNDCDAHLNAIAKIGNDFNCIKEIHLLPYHNLGIDKYKDTAFKAYIFPLPEKTYLLYAKEYLSDKTFKPIVLFD